MNSFWVLEKDFPNGKRGFYAGDGRMSFDISIAFSFGLKALAEEFLKRTEADPRIASFKDFIPTEYRLQRVVK